MKITNKKELEAAKKAIAAFETTPPNFEVNKFYRWNFPSWYKGNNPPHQGGRLQCVFVGARQACLQNQNGLHIVSRGHLISGDIGVTA